ncbi:MAG: response regulator, partial [Chloroflexota bacterium]
LAWLADDLAVMACLTKPVMAEQLLSQMAQLGAVEDVLIIDDDRRFVQLIRRIFETSNRSYKLRWAYSGHKGLLAIQRQRPDLVLLDLMMPDLDGFQVLKEIRQMPDLADVPIMLLTATSFAEDALTHGNSRLVVHRGGGLRSAEVLACLRAVMQVLEPHYDEKSMVDAPNLDQFDQADDNGKINSLNSG